MSCDPYRAPSKDGARGGAEDGEKAACAREGDRETKKNAHAPFHGAAVVAKRHGEPENDAGADADGCGDRARQVLLDIGEDVVPRHGCSRGGRERRAWRGYKSERQSHVQRRP